jgi:hypothetical protein
MTAASCSPASCCAKYDGELRIPTPLGAPPFEITTWQYSRREEKLALELLQTALPVSAKTRRETITWNTSFHISMSAFDSEEQNMSILTFCLKDSSSTTVATIVMRHMFNNQKTFALFQYLNPLQEQ